jgi:glyoxylase-like metal-dependent hydrolase (beta-lactamase superfamily II)
LSLGTVQAALRPPADAAPGHTPGHTVFAIFSSDQSLMVLGDTAQHPAVFARHPDQG